MAFVGAISDLFSCGKPRRPQTRDGANNTGDDATRTDATPNDTPDKTPADTAAPHVATLPPVQEDSLLQFDLLGSKGPDDSLPQSNRAPTEANATHRLEEAHAESPEVPQSRTRRLEPSNEKTKTGSGWQVEQRILVTTNATDTSNTPFKPSLDLVEASPVDVTPVVKAQHVTPTPPVEKEEAKVQEAEPAVVPQTVVEPKLVVEKKESEVEEIEHVVVPDAVVQPKVIEDVSSTPEVVVIPQAKEVSSILISEEISQALVPKEIETTAKQLPPTTPKQFLDLPIEIRTLIYTYMTEATPIRMCRHNDPALTSSAPHAPKRQFYNLTQVCHQLRAEFLPIYASHTTYILDLWAQKAHLTSLSTLQGTVALDIDAACFDMAPIDLLPLLRYLSRSRRTNIHFASTEGVVFHSIETIVLQLNKLLPQNNSPWSNALNSPMKRIDLHLFPHEDIRAYYRFRGAEPMLRIVYPSARMDEWMKHAHGPGDEYASYLAKTGLSELDMHVVVGHASVRRVNEGRMPLDWRLSYAGSRLSLDQAVRISGTFTR